MIPGSASLKKQVSTPLPCAANGPPLLPLLPLSEVIALAVETMNTGVLTCLPADTLSRNLQNSRLSRQYQLRLFQAGQLLFQFCLSTLRDPGVLVSNVKLANEFLIAFIQHLFQTRRPLWIATHAVLAVQIVNRSFRGCLRPAWDSIQSWKLGTPVLSRTPLPLP